MTFGGQTTELYMSNFRRNAPAWTAIVQSVATRAARRGRILDLASGPGEPARSLASAFPEARVLATDVEASMVEKQKTYLADLRNVESRVLDAENLSALDDVGDFDAVTCGNGVMYFKDRPAAFRGIRNKLAPKGSLVLTFWRDHKISTLAEELVDKLDRPDLAPYLLRPAKCAEEGLVDAELVDAGFAVVERTEGAYDFGPYDTFEDFYNGAILAFQAALNKVPDLAPDAKADLLSRAETELQIIADDRYVVHQLAEDGVSTKKRYCIPGNAFALIHAIKVSEGESGPEESKKAAAATG